MADTKISALTADTAPARTTDYAPTYDASAGATKKVLLENFGVDLYTVHFGISVNPADSTTYYFAPWSNGGATTTVGNLKTYIMRAGVVTDIRIFGIVTTGSAETSTISFRLNDTTDTTISSTAAFNATPFTIINSGLSIAVAKNDYFNIKWVSPAWATNPTALTMYAMIRVS